MTLTWAAFESALSGHLHPSGAIDALTVSSAVDIRAMLGRIGAGEAGRLLADALTAESETRLSKLAASLDIIDHHLPVGRVRKSTMLSRRSVWVGQVPTGDSVRSALVASLIDAELGGDPERLRARIAVVATGWEGVVAADLNGLSKSDRAAETSAARRALQTVLKLLLNELQSRQTT
jgi:hypothetical protein